MRLTTAQYSLAEMFEVGRRGLQAQQTNMAITGNNIANVHTEGYTRQRVELESMTPLQVGGFGIESGVLDDTIRRLRDTFFDIQMRNENPSLARWQEEQHQLSQVENILNEPNAMAVSNLMDEYFIAWEDLSHEPDSESSRAVVRDAGSSLAKNFNRIGSDLSTLQDEIDDSAVDTVYQINHNIREIADYTKRIMLAEDESSEISTLMDRRDLALDNLSKQIDINYIEKDNGDLLVFSNGIIVVEGDDFNQINSKINQDTDLHDFFWKNEDTQLIANNGKMKGLLNVRDTIIPELKEDLNKLVKIFVEEANKIHRENFNLEGTNGINFFDEEGLDLDTIKLDSNIEDDLKFIGASQTAGSLGNADGALAMVALQHEATMNNQSSSFKEFYVGIIMTQGTYVQEANRLADMQATFVNQLENKRNEVSEVDLDEELSNMIKFQQAYGAAAKIITKADEMLKQVIALVN